MASIAQLSHARSLGRNAGGRLQREAAALSLRELATAVGVTASTLSRWESGASRPRAQAALRWAAALDSVTTDRS